MVSSQPLKFGEATPRIRARGGMPNVTQLIRHRSDDVRRVVGHPTVRQLLGQ